MSGYYQHTTLAISIYLLYILDSGCFVWSNYIMGWFLEYLANYMKRVVCMIGMSGCVPTPQLSHYCPAIYCLSVISLFFSLTTYDALCPLKPAFSKGPKFDRGSPCPLNVPLSSCLLSCPLSLPPSLKERGNTPLHVASQAGQAMQVELLIIHGANPCTLDGLGHTPEECARSAVTSLKTNLRES